MKYTNYNSENKVYFHDNFIINLVGCNTEYNFKLNVSANKFNLLSLTLNMVLKVGCDNTIFKKLISIFQIILIVNFVGSIMD